MKTTFMHLLNEQMKGQVIQMNKATKQPQHTTIYTPHEVTAIQTRSDYDT